MKLSEKAGLFEWDVWMANLIGNVGLTILPTQSFRTETSIYDTV